MLCACAFALLQFSPARADGPWEAIARTDLTAIHQLLLDNHPGPVDAQNPNYRVWLEDGYRKEMDAANSAQNFYDYKRVILGYVNGFRDGHSNIAPTVDAVQFEWPGFLPGVGADGRIYVSVSEQDGVSIGDEILSCDSTPIGELFERNVAPYRWNRDIPQQRDLFVPMTLLTDAGDTKVKPNKCDLKAGGQVRTVPLQWRYVSRAKALDLRAQASGRTIPQLGLRKIDGIWFLSLPGFDYQSGADVARFKQVLKDVSAHETELRNAERLVIDVRGNRGGISDWCLTAAGNVWGDAIVKKVAASLPGDVDWRASKANLAHIENFLNDAKQNGLPQDDIDELTGVRDSMLKAIAEGRPFAHEPSPVSPAPDLSSVRLKGTVYFLTDGICTSACLDFADVVLRLPNVVQVGRATDADASYIDLNDATLPSGLGRFQYSMKVYRTRVRGNNEWYEPTYKWPGGLMTDDAVAKWIATLPLAAPGAHTPKPHHV